MSHTTVGSFALSLSSLSLLEVPLSDRTTCVPIDICVCRWQVFTRLRMDILLSLSWHFGLVCSSNTSEVQSCSEFISRHTRKIFLFSLIYRLIIDFLFYKRYMPFYCFSLPLFRSERQVPLNIRLLLFFVLPHTQLEMLAILHAQWVVIVSLVGGKQASTHMSAGHVINFIWPDYKSATHFSGSTFGCTALHTVDWENLWVYSHLYVCIRAINSCDKISIVAHKEEEEEGRTPRRSEREREREASVPHTHTGQHSNGLGLI